MGRIQSDLAGWLVLSGILAATVGITPAHAGEKKLDVDLCAPDENDFTLDVDNDYFPLPVDRQWVLVGEEDEGTLAVMITVLDDTEVLYAGTSDPVVTRVVEECEWIDARGDGVFDEEDDELIEVSLNFFAQTQDGNVCYFGEEVTEFENGTPVPGGGAWRADEEGNAPGIFMPADPVPGMKFQQEVAPGIAEDEAKVVGIGPITVPADTFEETIRLREFNPLDGGKDFKVYALDVGILRDADAELVDFGALGRTPCSDLL